MSYRVTVELDAPSISFDVGKVAMVISMALVNADVLEELVINRLDVEREDA